MWKKRDLGAAVFACFAVLWSVPVMAQDKTGCTTNIYKNPNRVVYQCDNGLSIEAESTAALRAIFPNAVVAPKSVRIQNRAVLIDLPSGSGPFQIQTPHAIASVRGTRYIVNATPEKTVVYVIEGSVNVERTFTGRDTREAVRLFPRDGVVVAPNSPMIAKRWHQNSAQSLLDRFSK